MRSGLAWLVVGTLGDHGVAGRVAGGGNQSGRRDESSVRPVLVGRSDVPLSGVRVGARTGDLHRELGAAGPAADVHPAAVRLRNLIRPEQMPYVTEVVTRDGLPSVR